MSTVAPPPQPPPRTARRSRQNVADEIKDVLGNEPVSAAQIAREIGVPLQSSGSAPNVVLNALDVLAARGAAKRIPDEPGRRGGWVSPDSTHEEAIAPELSIEFDYEFNKKMRFDDMFVDESYQRPLTTFAREIERNFDPYLFGCLVLSDRGPKAKPRHAIIDGQTRWVAASNIGVRIGPGQIFKNLTVEDEADLFWRFQKNRKGMVSWHRMRAQIRAGDEKSIAIMRLVEGAGYQLGEQDNNLRAMSALEKAYASDDFILERVLNDLKAAWPDDIPQAIHISGLHFFFRHFPMQGRRPGQNRTAPAEVDDERLVRRLRVAGPDGLARKMNAAKDLGGKGTNQRFMAMAIESAYLSGGRS